MIVDSGNGGYLEGLLRSLKSSVLGSMKVVKILKQTPNSGIENQQRSIQYLDGKLHVHLGMPKLPMLNLSSLPESTRSDCKFRKEKNFIRCFSLTDSLVVSCTEYGACLKELGDYTSSILVQLEPFIDKVLKTAKTSLKIFSK